MFSRAGFVAVAAKLVFAEAVVAAADSSAEAAAACLDHLETSSRIQSLSILELPGPFCV